MDVKELVEKFTAELTCSIYQRYLTDPVMVPCGHCFCKGCLDPNKASFTCPRCHNVMRCRSNLSINRSMQKLSFTAHLMRPHLEQTILDVTPHEPCEEKEKLPCEEDPGCLSVSGSCALEHIVMGCWGVQGETPLDSEHLARKTIAIANGLDKNL